MLFINKRKTVKWGTIAALSTALTAGSVYAVETDNNDDVEEEVTAAHTPSIQEDSSLSSATEAREEWKEQVRERERQEEKEEALTYIEVAEEEETREALEEAVYVLSNMHRAPESFEERLNDVEASIVQAEEEAEAKRLAEIEAEEQRQREEEERKERERAEQEEAERQAQAEREAERAEREAEQAQAETIPASTDSAESSASESSASEVTTSSSEEPSSPSSNGQLIGTFSATAFAVGDGLTPNLYTRDGTDVSSSIYGPDGHRIIAVDTGVIPLGTTVRVVLPNGNSFIATARDTGSAINGNIIDIFMSSPSEAISFGRQSGIEIYRVN